MYKGKKKVDLNKSYDQIKTKSYKNKNKDFYSINPSSSSINLKNSIKSCELINKYIELNNQASNFITPQGQAKKALSSYKEASEIAEQLNDNFKINESKCNQGIAYYHLNDIKKAISLLKPCYINFCKICSNGQINSDIKNLIMLCKSGVNLCMCKILLFHDKSDCKEIINDIINIIEQENDLNVQIFCIRYINNILFGVGSLLSINSNLISSYLKYSNMEIDLNSSEELGEETNKINQLFYESFFNFIATKEFDPWIQSLDAIYKKMEKLNFKNGMINILFNQQIAICLKYLFNDKDTNILNNNNSELDEAKLKLSSLIKSVSTNEKMGEYEEEDEIDEKEINNIINDYRYKLSIIIDIYDLIHPFEEKLNNNLEYSQNKNDEKFNKKYSKYSKNKYNYYHKELNFNINGKFFLVLLLRYTISYFEKNIKDHNLKNELINNIKNALNAINDSEISGLDFSNIDLSSIDPGLSNNLINLFSNLFYIYERSELKRYFEKFRYGVNYNNKLRSYKKHNLGKFGEKGESIQIEKKLDRFFNIAYSHIYNGELINKVNFRSKGAKIHYFQIENKNDCLQYFLENKSKSSKKEFDFDYIKRVRIGIETPNIKNKLNTVQISNRNKETPYKFMSFILGYDENNKINIINKTIDLVFDDEKSANYWFYGLYYYLQISQRPFKICSCTNFLLLRLKTKMINKLGSDINKIKKKPFTYYMKKYFNNILKKQNNNQNDDDDDNIH
jgi:hypothetical protein